MNWFIKESYVYNSADYGNDTQIQQNQDDDM